MARGYAAAVTVADQLPEMPRVSPFKRVTGSFAQAKPGHLVLAAALLLFFAVFLLWPIAQVVIAGFTDRQGNFTVEYLRLIWADEKLRLGLWNATVIALLTTAVVLVMSLPLAVLNVRYEFRGKGLLGGLLLVPLVLPPFVGAVGMKQVLGRSGPLTQALEFVGFDLPMGVDWLGSLRLPGIVAVMALHLYPIMLLNLQASLANIDPAMEQAAANLGASRWTIFRKITLPLIRPGLFAGCTLVLIWSFTELGTPLMFQYRDVTAVQVFERITEAGDSPTPYALVVVMLIASVVLYLIGKVLFGRGYDAATTKASTASTARTLTGWRGLLAMLPFVVVFGLAVLPHLSVILTSFSGTGAWYDAVLPSEYTLAHYSEALGDDAVFGGVVNSLLYAALATLLAVVVGLGVAVIVVRSKVPGRGLLDALAMLPLAVPGLVLAFGYLGISITLTRFFGDAAAVNTAETGPALWAAGLTGDGAGPLFWLNVQEYPAVLLVLAYASRRLPYVVRSAVAGLQQTPQDLELAAANLGARRWRVLTKITVPLIVANLLAGGLLAFAFAMLEVSDSLILAQRSDYYPLTKVIYEFSQALGTGQYIAAAMGVWAMLLLTLTILTANALMARRLGAIFRL